MLNEAGIRQDIYSSTILARSISFAASLCHRFSRPYICERLGLVAEQFERIEAAANYFLSRPSRFELNGIAEISSEFSCAGTSNTVIALSQLGHPVLTLAALARAGVSVATVYWQIGARDREILSSSGVALLDLNGYSNPRSVLRTLAELQNDGYAVALMVDAPMRSRQRYAFLDYRVRCSSMLEVYSQLYRRYVYITRGCLVTANRMNFSLQRIPSCPLLTQDLLVELTDSIFINIEDYNWSPASIIFSDQNALINGLSFLEPILARRSITV